VRDLPPGERPSDWANDGGDDIESTEAELPVGPVPADQFSTVEEHVHLVERAKALMARQRPGVSLGELHLEAMKLLVASLEKRKFAVRAATPPRQRRERGSGSAPRQRGSDARQAAGNSASLRKRSRHIPAAVRREVYERDGGRCSYIDARGGRCCEARCLELHHLEPFAKGGAHSASNLALRCPAHNRLAAEQDFGQELVAQRRDAARHESRSKQLVGEPNTE
jgi:hypothetical protein